MSDHNAAERRIGRPNAWIRNQSTAIPWLWEGVVAEHAVTLLSAPEKIGKTTLLSLLLDRRRAGGQLLGRTVWPGNTILCSEEHDRLWALRQPPLDFGPGLTFHTPESGSPTRRRWQRFIDDLCDLSLPERLFDLLVIDTAMSFMPLADRNKRTLRWALNELSLVGNFPAGILILNQSRNVHRPLASFADIVIEMTIPRGVHAAREGVAGVTRRRTFTGVGRYPGTLQTANAELNPEGTDYILLPDSAPPHPPLLATLQTLLTESPTPLTRRELIARWPGAAPHEDSLWRTLARGVQHGLFVITGGGTKTDPFRYGIASRTNGAEQAAG